jgi:hypothetical protein
MLISFLLILIYCSFLNIQVVFGELYTIPAELEHAIEVIIQRNIKGSLKHLPEQFSAHIGIF